MNITCAILEDEPLARSLMEQHVKKVPSLELVQSFSNPLVALEALRDDPPDLLFLDVQMPELTGISLLRILDPKPLVVLTTAYSDYALDGYEFDVVDYLLKPITFERFLQAIEKVNHRLPTATANSPMESSQEYFFVKDGTKLIKINVDEVQYIESLKDYVQIHTPQGKTTTLQTMKALERLLPEEHFIRVHNSFIVSLRWVDVIHRDELQIGKAIIPISDTYKKRFREFVDRHNLG